MTLIKYANYRFLLSVLFRILVFVGLIFILIPFVTSMYDDDKSLNSESNQFITVNAGNLKSGEFKKINIAYVPVWIYKRRQNEIDQLDRMSPLLADSESRVSIQPEQCRNQYRSYEAQYFVFKPIESMRSCNIRYLDSPGAKLSKLLAEKNLNWLGGFTESCFGSIYDLSGRRYSGTGKKEQKNLVVPEHSFKVYSINNTKRQGDVIQFEFKSVVINE